MSIRTLTQLLPATLEKAHAELQKRDAKIEYLSRQVAMLQKALYGRSSEKRPLPEDSGAQTTLFDAPDDSDGKDLAEESTAARPKRGKKGGRRPFPEHLERREEVVDVTAEEKVCSCGCEKHRMGEDTTEELEIIPAQIFVRKIIRPKYVCRKCSGSIIQQTLPERPIPRCIAGPALLAHLIVYKYEDHLPLCRLEKILSGMGIDHLTRSHMCQWVMRLTTLCRPLIAQMQKRLLESSVLNVDETPLTVIQPGGGSKKQYLWVYVSDSASPYCVYDYQPTRSRAGPEKMLSGFEGFLQTDGYSVYKRICARVDENGSHPIMGVGCWAHARRKFKDAEEQKEARAKKPLDLIGRLYAIEKRLNETREEMSEEEFFARRLEVRKEKSAPILDELFSWMRERLDVLPKSALGGAIGYTEDRETELRRYITDGRIAIDNNIAERSIRPVALGRKNWLFAGSERGGEAAATFFTLLASARRHGLNPHRYLRDIFLRLPSQNIQNLDEFLPDKWECKTEDPLLKT